MPISEDRQELLEQAMKVNGIRPYRLPRGSGHDAMLLGTQIPIVMLFVKSKDGASAITRQNGQTYMTVSKHTRTKNLYREIAVLKSE